MGQFGMQLPGGKLRRAASMNVYTGLLFAAVLALIAACGFMAQGAGKVGKDGGMFTPQEQGRITLKAPAGPGAR